MDHWRGTAEFSAALKGIETKALAVTQTALREAAAEGVTEARSSFGSGVGPHSKSGHLAGTIAASEPVAKGLNGYTLFFGPSGPYARKVELGKQGARSAGPHPYMQPGFKRAEPKFIDIFRKHWATIHGR